MIEALRDAGVAYVLLTIAGGVDQLAPLRAGDHAGFHA